MKGDLSRVEQCSRGLVAQNSAGKAAQKRESSSVAWHIIEQSSVQIPGKTPPAPYHPRRIRALYINDSAPASIARMLHYSRAETEDDRGRIESCKSETEHLAVRAGLTLDVGDHTQTRRNRNQISMTQQPRHATSRHNDTTRHHATRY